MKVAKVIDNHAVAITRSDGRSLQILSIGDILCIHGSDSVVTDPDTGEKLGNLPMLRVKVTEVYDRFVIAETYQLTHSLTYDNNQTVTVNIGDEVKIYQESKG